MNKSLIFLFLLIGIYLASAEEYEHPLFATSYANANDNVTLYRFRILNNETTQTLPFRVWLTSDMNWFDPSIFSYALQPDGSDQGKPYWDLPPIYPNESSEISFTVNRTVGLPDRISVSTQQIDRWSGECSDFAPYNGSSSSKVKIQTYLQSLNKSGNVTLYYEEGDYAIAYLEYYKTYAVFTINNITMVDDETIISSLASNYTKKVATPVSVDLSEITSAFEGSVTLKADAEAECYRISGMDRNPCVDRDSCLYACFSVPVCSNIGQVGWDFMDTLLDFNQTVSTTNLKLDQMIVSSADFENSPTYEKAEALLEEMIDLNRQETEVIYHPLYISYGFCPPAEYGIPQQLGARRILLDYLEENCIYGKENFIVEESLHTAEVLAPPKPKPPVNVNQTINTSTNTSIPNVTITNNTIQNTSQNTTECCIGSICSIGGVKTIAGICWQWATIGVVLILAIVFYITKPKRR
ncbi:MAG: hypothetical protein ABH842_05585 [Candidatus Micrarchaeota archaeon]